MCTKVLLLMFVVASWCQFEMEFCFVGLWIWMKTCVVMVVSAVKISYLTE